jgi:osmoprotectant transport system ATP-binding protein
MVDHSTGDADSAEAGSLCGDRQASPEHRPEPGGPNEAIVLKSVSKSYDRENLAVDDVDLGVVSGELLVLVGESGCGKTTLLKMVNRLVERSAGCIRVDGVDIDQTPPAELRRRIGYVFQGIGLFPHLTVAQNVAVVPRLLRWESRRTDARVNELLEMVNLPRDYRDRLPGDLSGGQQQRVGLARALAAEPRIVLMDEPFGALDPINRDQLQDDYRQLHMRLGVTTMMVTHDMTEALLMADRIAVMGDGKLLQLDAPARLLARPADDRVSQFLETPKRHAAKLESMIGQRTNRRSP